MNRPKVTVVGAGFVGAEVARRIVERDLADVILVDIIEGLPQGKALDIQESAPLEGFEVRITGTNDYAPTKDSDLIVITAGLARKPGMSRDDLLFKNEEIVSGIVSEISRYSKNPIYIVVTNPLDVMTTLVWRKTRLPNQRVFGMAGVLDSARYATFIALELGASPKEVKAMVLGGHGDDMVPLPRYTTVKGAPITELLSKEKIEAIHQRTREGGAEIVSLLKSGSAFYAPSSSVVQMVEAVLRDTGRVLPCCVYLNGEYGLKDVYCGVPAILGREGVSRVVELSLSPEELSCLHQSADHVRENVAKLKSLPFERGGDSPPYKGGMCLPS